MFIFCAGKEKNDFDIQFQGELQMGTSSLIKDGNLTTCMQTKAEKPVFLNLLLNTYKRHLVLFGECRGADIEFNVTGADHCKRISQKYECPLNKNVKNVTIKCQNDTTLQMTLCEAKLKGLFVLKFIIASFS